MIYLFVLLVMTAAPSPDDAAWTRGNYTWRSFTFETIAACEAKRAAMIRTAWYDSEMLIREAHISKCAAPKEEVEYNVYEPKRAPTRPSDLKGDKS